MSSKPLLHPGDVLQVIDLPYDSLELRGEVYMSHEDFEKRIHALLHAGIGTG